MTKEMQAEMRRTILEALAKEVMPELDVSRIVFRINTKLSVPFVYKVYVEDEKDIYITIHETMFSGLIHGLREVVRNALEGAFQEMEEKEEEEYSINIRELAPDKKISPNVAGEAFATLIEKAGGVRTKKILWDISKGDTTREEYMLSVFPYLSKRQARALWYFALRS